MAVYIGLFLALICRFTMIFSPYNKKRTFSLPEISQIEVTEVAIKLFNLDQLTQKMSQIEAKTIKGM